MGYFDYFVGNLLCPVCEVVSDADHLTNIHTNIRKKPQFAYLGVGHPLEIDLEEMKDSGYLLIQMPKLNEAIRILQIWECPSCGNPYNWVKIVVFEEIIAEITNVPLNREVLENAHFISDDCIDEVKALTEFSYQELRKMDLVQMLKELL